VKKGFGAGLVSSKVAQCVITTVSMRLPALEV
jgi:hypothetical protein